MATLKGRAKSIHHREGEMWLFKNELTEHIFRHSLLEGIWGIWTVGRMKKRGWEKSSTLSLLTFGQLKRGPDSAIGKGVSDSKKHLAWSKLRHRDVSLMGKTFSSYFSGFLWQRHTCLWIIHDPHISTPETAPPRHDACLNLSYGCQWWASLWVLFVVLVSQKIKKCTTSNFTEISCTLNLILVKWHSTIWQTIR